MRDTNVPRSDTRSAILKAAIKVLARDPRTPLGELAEQAGVGRATLHRYFKSRDELVKEIAMLSVREIDEAVEGLEQRAESAAHLLELILEAVVPLGDRFYFLANEAWVATDPGLKAELDRQIAELEALVEACKAEGSIDQSVPAAWVVGVVDSTIYAAWNLVASGQIAPRDASSLAFKTIMNGVSS